MEEDKENEIIMQSRRRNKSKNKGNKVNKFKVRKEIRDILCGKYFLFFKFFYTLN